jgi:small subunit ribosomal protein S2
LAVEITMKELLEAGVHFGHQTRRWNPKMKEYIFGERNGIHIIDLQKTLKMFRDASRFVGELSAQGKVILFVGTKRQAQGAVAEEARRCGMFFVNHRWLGGTLTNWATLQKSIKRLKTLKAMIEDGRMAQLSKKEAARLEREMKHLNQNLEGVENMTALPDAMFVVDSHAEAIAVREARRMGVPVVAIVDTNCDPEQVNWVIPGNDDALRAIRLFTSKISDAVVEGRTAFEQTQIAEEKATGAGAADGDAVEYVDTSAYEAYEKQEGDFVEPGQEGADAVAEAAPEATDDATVAPPAADSTAAVAVPEQTPELKS